MEDYCVGNSLDKLGEDVKAYAMTGRHIKVTNSLSVGYSLNKLGEVAKAYFMRGRYIKVTN